MRHHLQWYHLAGIQVSVQSGYANEVIGDHAVALSFEISRPNFDNKLERHLFFYLFIASIEKITIQTVFTNVPIICI